MEYKKEHVSNNPRLIQLDILTGHSPMCCKSFVFAKTKLLQHVGECPVSIHNLGLSEFNVG